jgi:hypothetical protein
MNRIKALVNASNEELSVYLRQVMSQRLPRSAFVLWMNVHPGGIVLRRGRGHNNQMPDSWLPLKIS